MRPDIEKLAQELKQDRDELRVQLHLAKAEAKDEWEKAEEKWEDLEAKLDQVGDATKDSAGDVLAAAALLGDELKNAYRRVRKLI